MGGSFSQVTFKIKLTAAIERCKMQQGKKNNKCAVDRREIAQLLAQGKDEAARFRAEALLTQENLINAIELYMLQSNAVLQRLRLLTDAKFCPDDLLESCASMIYFGRRVGEIHEASNEVIQQLGYKFGRDWVQSHAENHSGSVSPRMVALLSPRPPPIEAILDVLREISVQFNVPWSPKIIEDNKPDARGDPQAIGQVASIRPKVPPLPPQTGLEPPGCERYMSDENPVRRTLMVRAQDMDLGPSIEDELNKYPGVLNISVHRGRDLYNTSWTNAGVGQSGAQSVYVKLSLYNRGAGSPPFGTNTPESLQRAISNAMSDRPGGVTADVLDSSIFTTPVDELSGTVPVWNSPFYSFKINAPWTKVCFQVFAKGTLKDSLIGSTIVNAHYLAYLMQREHLKSLEPIEGGSSGPVSPINVRTWLLIGRGKAYGERAGAIEITADFQPFFPVGDAQNGSGAEDGKGSSSSAASPSNGGQEQKVPPVSVSKPEIVEQVVSIASPTHKASHGDDLPPPNYEDSLAAVEEESMTLIPDSAAEAGFNFPEVPSSNDRGAKNKARVEEKEEKKMAPEKLKAQGEAISSKNTGGSSKPKFGRESLSQTETKGDTSLLAKTHPAFDDSVGPDDSDKIVSQDKGENLVYEKEDSDEALHSMLWAMDLPEPPKTDVGSAVQKKDDKKSNNDDNDDEKDGGNDDGSGGSGNGRGKGGELVEDQNVPIIVSLPSPSTKNSAKEMAAATAAAAAEATSKEASGEVESDPDNILAARLAALSK